MRGYPAGASGADSAPFGNQTCPKSVACRLVFAHLAMLLCCSAACCLQAAGSVSIPSSCGRQYCPPRLTDRMRPADLLSHRNASCDFDLHGASRLTGFASSLGPNTTEPLHRPRAPRPSQPSLQTWAICLVCYSPLGARSQQATTCFCCGCSSI